MLKLGTQTGSLINHFMSSDSAKTPEVGMGATLLSWTDRTPATVQRVFKIGKCVAIEVTLDDYKRIDENGVSEIQEYEYTTNPNGSKRTYKLTERGWKCVWLNPSTNRYIIKDSTGGIALGRRERYYDFSF